jgi:hypothetical protein
MAGPIMCGRWPRKNGTILPLVALGETPFSAAEPSAGPGAVPTWLFASFCTRYQSFADPGPEKQSGGRIGSLMFREDGYPRVEGDPRPMERGSVQDGRQVATGGLVVEAGCHERHYLDHL